jgi:hypothetical protein
MVPHALTVAIERTPFLVQLMQPDNPFNRLPTSGTTTEVVIPCQYVQPALCAIPGSAPYAPQ